MISIEPNAKVTENTTLVFRIIGLREGHFQTLGFRTATPRGLEQELRDLPHAYGVTADNTVAVYAPKGRK